MSSIDGQIAFTEIKEASGPDGFLSELHFFIPLLSKMYKQIFLTQKPAWINTESCHYLTKAR